jgi:hypothetical protein
MCWHLSISVPRNGVQELHRLLPQVAPATSELNSGVIAAIAMGGECFCLGIHCACGLFRKGASASERLQKRAKRDHWSDAKLQRAIKGLKDNWSGLHPQVREALAALARNEWTVKILLFWDGRGGRSDVRDVREVNSEALLKDSSLVAENRLLVIRDSAASQS